MKIWWLKIAKKQTPKPVLKGRISSPFGFYKHLKFKLWPAITFFLYKIFECSFFPCFSFDILYIISKNQHSSSNRKKSQKFAEKPTFRAFPGKTSLLTCAEKNGWNAKRMDNLNCKLQKKHLLPLLVISAQTWLIRMCHFYSLVWA